MSKGKRPGKMVNCENCDKEFYINPSRFKNKSHNCSKVCLGKTNSKKHSKKVKVPCMICGVDVFYKLSHFKKIKNHTCSYECCHQLKKTTNKGKNNPRSLKLTQRERIFSKKLDECKRRSLIRGIVSDITLEYLINIFDKQKGKCYYSGVDMILKSVSYTKRAADHNVMSIDRIDPNRGYTKDNIVLCCNCVNMLKAHHNFKTLEPIIEGLFNNIKKGEQNEGKL